MGGIIILKTKRWVLIRRIREEFRRKLWNIYGTEKRELFLVQRVGTLKLILACKEAKSIVRNIAREKFAANHAVIICM